jgi:hypothetical protein
MVPDIRPRRHPGTPPGEGGSSPKERLTSGLRAHQGRTQPGPHDGFRTDPGGIDAADLPHVFERFYRSAAARAVNGAWFDLTCFSCSSCRFLNIGA